jgi:hypothetical protein
MMTSDPKASDDPDGEPCVSTAGMAPQPVYGGLKYPSRAPAGRYFYNVDGMVWDVTTANETAKVKVPVPEGDTPDIVQQNMLRDIDAILTRIDAGIAEQHKRMDSLLERLAKNAA